MGYHHAFLLARHSPLRTAPKAVHPSLLPCLRVREPGSRGRVVAGDSSSSPLTLPRPLAWTCQWEAQCPGWPQCVCPAAHPQPPGERGWGLEEAKCCKSKAVSCTASLVCPSFPTSLQWVRSPGRPEAVRRGNTPGLRNQELPTDLTTEKRGRAEVASTFNTHSLAPVASIPIPTLRLETRSSLSFTRTPPPFTDWNSEVQKGKMICPRAHSTYQ